MLKFLEKNFKLRGLAYYIYTTYEFACTYIYRDAEIYREREVKEYSDIITFT